MADFSEVEKSSSDNSHDKGGRETVTCYSSDEECSDIDGPLGFLTAQMKAGVPPETVLRNILGPSVQIPPDADEVSLWEAVLELVFRPPPREPLPDVTSPGDVVKLIEQSNNIIVLSGAGISVSCGIPDFRSPNGIYAKLAVEFPELVEPQAMFDINFFELDPRPFFKFAKEIFPGKHTPSPCHKFIAALERKGKLLRNYTQNIDTLERTAGITRVMYCHGSFATASCRLCKHQVPIEELKDTILKEEVPYCAKCTKLKEDLDGKRKNRKTSKTSYVEEEEEEERVGVMKPDIVFFGEGLPDSFHEQLQKDKKKADLLIVMGSSLKVRPVSLIPDMLPEGVPRVLINRERLQYIRGFDVRLLGYGDTVVRELCARLGGDWLESVGGASTSSSAMTSSPEERVHLFDGAIWSGRDPEDKGRGQSGCGQEPGCSVNIENGCGQYSDGTSHGSPSVDDIVTNGSNHGNTTPPHANCPKRNTNEHHHDDDHHHDDHDITVTPNKLFKPDPTDC